MRRFRAPGLVAFGTLVGVVGAGAFLKRALPSAGDELSGEVSLVGALGGVELTSRASSFAGGSVLAWLGGVELDLREASLAPAAALAVHTLLGGAVIRVPADWRVDSRVHVLLGGLDTPSADDAAADAPTLTVAGFAVLGGIVVRRWAGATRT